MEQRTIDQLIDISDLKVKGVSTRADLIPIEAKNVRKAIVKYFSKPITRRTARFDLSWALKLHWEMLGDVWKSAGKIRLEPRNLGLAPHLIETALDELLKNLPFWKDDPFPEQAARLHFEAVRIHPFNDGNGRWSRMLANVWLWLNRQPITRWPDTALTDNSTSIRAEYLSAIKAADKGELDALIQLHARYTNLPS